MLTVGRLAGLASTLMLWVTLVLLPAASVRVATRLWLPSARAARSAAGRLVLHEPSGCTTAV
ncbi:hypothetical protein D3C81_2027860 [compost metagenome]